MIRRSKLRFRDSLMTRRLNKKNKLKPMLELSNLKRLSRTVLMLIRRQRLKKKRSN